MKKNKINEILDLVSKVGQVDDEYFKDTEERYFYERFTGAILKYSEDNYIPYDLNKHASRFCGQGCILKRENTFYGLEYWSGQGSIVICSLIEDERLDEVKNYIDLDDFVNNVEHRDYKNNRNTQLMNRILRILLMRSVEKEDAIKILENAINKIK